MKAWLSREILIGVALVALADALVVTTRVSWLGLFGYTAEWVNGALYVTSPLIAGSAAFTARSFLRPDVLALLGARTHRAIWRLVVRVWMRIAVVFAFAHYVVIGVALCATALFSGSGAVAWQPFVYALLPIGMAVAVGVAIAGVFPRTWGAVLAVVVSYSIWFVAVVTDSIVPINVGGATISLVGLSYSVAGLVVSCVAALVVTGSFLLAGLAALRTTSFAIRVSSVVGVAILIMVAGPAFGQFSRPSPFVPSAEPAFTCAGVAPRVCLTEPHATRIEDIANGIHSASTVLTRVGADLSDVTLYEETYERGHPNSGVLMLSFQQLNGIGVSRQDFAYALLRPADCDDFYEADATPRVEHLLAATSLLQEWMDQSASGKQTSLTDAQALTLFNGLKSCEVRSDVLSSTSAY
ncbi:hypothetical protein [Microbacterium halophytorum]|uniref:hypothetical protein n=1 Tax=Microbacterium halophytorum TaxID=2067568 RepID=UPI000CFBA3D1|nr:hypothetical protein [Microbacterium halophytorum]